MFCLNLKKTKFHGLKLIIILDFITQEMILFLFCKLNINIICFEIDFSIISERQNYRLVQIMHYHSSVKLKSTVQRCNQNVLVGFEHATFQLVGGCLSTKPLVLNNNNNNNNIDFV